MDYRRAISEKYQTSDFCVGKTYESLHWWDERPKPTDQELIEYYELHKDEWSVEFRRYERDVLLKNCDHCALPDFPNREPWLIYRQQLRDLPANWTIDTPYPTPPE